MECERTVSADRALGRGSYEKITPFLRVDHLSMHLARRARPCHVKVRRRLKVAGYLWLRERMIGGDIISPRVALI